MRATHAGALVCSCLLLAGAGALPGASSDDHLWVIVRTPAPGSRIELRHCAPGTDGPFYTRGLTLAVDDPDAVEAMAAWGNQLWLVFAPTPPAFPTPGEAPRRETFTVQVHRNPALEAWYHVPHDRLRAVASLQGAGTLAGFVGTADGPVAMIVDRMAQGPGLVQLRGPQWQELSLPQGLGPGPWWLGSSGPDGRSLVLLGEPDRPGGPATVHRRDGAGAWSAGEATLGPGRPRSLTRVGGNVALVVERAPQGPVEVAYVRPGVLLRLARLTPPEGRWSVLGTRDGLSLLEQVPEGEVAISTIDPISGTVGQRQVMAPQRLMTVRVLHRPLLMALGITALMVIVLFKPSASASAVVLPVSMVTLPPLRRLVAVAVDLALSAVVTLLVFRCPVVELLWWPLWTADLAVSVPFLAMIGLTVAHCTLAELAAASTIGKKLLGAKVVSCDGARPRARAIIVRNALKVIVLLIPVLAVFALLDPHVRGLGDHVARTVVVRTRRGGGDAAPNDR
ncbi:MAG: RDD family protein [Planctomycetota bacterium]|jgi:uncharacterized RDD family membrane protein YckC